MASVCVKVSVGECSFKDFVYIFIDHKNLSAIEILVCYFTTSDQVLESGEMHVEGR
jgi:hypothetical protein